MSASASAKNLALQQSRVAVRDARLRNLAVVELCRVVVDASASLRADEDLADALDDLAFDAQHMNQKSEEEVRLASEVIGEDLRSMLRNADPASLRATIALLKSNAHARFVLVSYAWRLLTLASAADAEAESAQQFLSNLFKTLQANVDGLTAAVAKRNLARLREIIGKQAAEGLPPSEAWTDQHWVLFATILDAARRSHTDKRERTTMYVILKRAYGDLLSVFRKVDAENYPPKTSKQQSRTRSRIST